MNVYTTDKIRNVVLLGHGGTGKTTIAEAMAYLTGVTAISILSVKRMKRLPPPTARSSSWTARAACRSAPRRRGDCATTRTFRV